MEMVKQRLELKIFLLAIVALAAILRFYPGKDYFLWNTSDFARDSFTMRQMIADKDLKLLGPRSEVFDANASAYLVYTGPLFYYLLGPWYHLGHGDPNWPLVFNILLHLSIFIPLAKLSKALLPNSRWWPITLVFWAASYEAIEYSRWLLNPAMALPFLAWFYYFLFRYFSDGKHLFFAGLSLGLAIQSEIFLVYWFLAVIFIWLIRKTDLKQKISDLGKFVIGTVIGLLPLVIAEIKYHFRATRSLLNYVLTSASEHQASFIKTWFEHWRVLMEHNLLGIFSSWWWLLMLIIFSILIYQFIKNKNRIALFFLILLTCHSAIFIFHFQPSIYIDLGVGLILILLVGYFLQLLMASSKYWWLGAIVLLVVAWNQIYLLEKNTLAGKPFGGHFFRSSDTFLFGDRLEIVDQIYQQLGNQPFSLSILDLPYGWPTTWASVFEQYQFRTGANLPKIYGFSVDFVPGDQVFEKTNQPLAKHVTLISQTQYIDQPTVANFLSSQQAIGEVTKSWQQSNVEIEIR